MEEQENAIDNFRIFARSLKNSIWATKDLFPFPAVYRVRLVLLSFIWKVMKVRFFLFLFLSMFRGLRIVSFFFGDTAMMRHKS